jgi:serine O-acetyltransferase
MSSAARVPELPPELFLRPDGAGPFGINDASAVVVCDRSLRHMLAMMRADVAEFRSHWKEPVVRRLYPGIFIAWTYRFTHWLHVNGLRAPAMLVMWACHAITGAEIRPGAVLGPGLMVVHPSGVVVNGGAVAGSRLQLYGANLLGANLAHGQHGTPRLGDDVILSHGAMAMGPILIGDGALVGAMSLVLHDVAAGATVKGIPAK